MAINGIGYGSSLLSQSVLNIKSQLADLQTQLATGQKSTTYSGMGTNEGFAIAARTQLANISAFTDTMTNINTNINVASTALDAISSIATQVQTATGSGVETVNGASGQTSGQQTAVSQLSSMLGILNTQSGNRYVFSGSAIDTPSVASADAILNGTGAQAGLKQLISERNQADLGANGLGRLVITPPSAAAPTTVSVAEDVAGSPFGLKLNSVTSTLTGATVTGPTGSPPAVSVALGATNPNNGDQVNFTFNLPDGTTESIQLTASNATPLPTGSFAIGATPAATAANLNTALNTSIGTLANTSLVAASAMAASNNFFNATALASGSAVNSKAATPVTGATLLSGGAATNSLGTNFAAGDTITVNGTPITFVASGATGNQVNVTDSVQTLMTKIDSITGTSTPSTIGGGAITLNGGTASNLTVTSSNSAAFAALGFGASVNAPLAPVRVGGTPLNAATSLVAGTPANTVSWYTGEAGTGSARATSTALIDQSQTVQYGARANEQAIRTTLQAVATLAAVTTPATSPNASAQIAALNERVTSALTPQAGQQTIANIQSDFANAQITMKDATARQSQSQLALQDLVGQTENVSSDQVASQILSLQTSLQASYQTTSMLSQLTLVKYLPVG
jgi:flagellar hook-associated protein 3 FlgL